MTKSVELSCERFIEALSSSEPAPGGGGAAALVGAIGVGLGDMVGALTVGKPRYIDAEPEILELMLDADDLQAHLLALVEADAQAFVPLSAAYGLPSATDEEKAHKAEVLEACLRDAAVVPLDIMRACGRAIELCVRFAAVGSPIVLSDAGCGVIICKAALQAASLNVFVNTRLMKDRVHAELCEAQARELLDKYLPMADATFANVEECLR
ncbi:MAG: cyclodeaminase/cyclohydrolase family protein [Coriobacteriales bacterium]